jgi:trigger factor
VTSTTHEALQGEDIQVSIHKKPFCLIELDVKAGKKIIDEAKKEAIKTVSKEVTLPGFRKGKAPEQTILKRYPQDVERQMHKTLAHAAYTKAQKLAQVSPLNHNAKITFDLKNCSEETAELVFSFETEPVIPAVDPKFFIAKPVNRAEVGEKQVNEAIKQMRFFFAEWKPIDDRAIQDGDYIMIDLDTLEDGVAHKVFRDVRFEVSKERMAPWMQKLVQGAKAGDILEGTSEADETATEEERKEFKPKQVRLSILKVEAAELPALDDELAKKVGAQNVEEMHKSIEKMLNEQASEGARESLHEQVNIFLTEHYIFDLPKSLVVTEKEHRKQQLLKDPQFKKKWDHEMSLEEKEQMDEKLFQEAHKAVRLFYLARAIVQQANISITQQEVQQEAINTMRSWNPAAVQPDNIPKEVFALALSKVILAKAEDYIIENGSKEEISN